ncbi:MAG TPA: SDR family oxidoreductase, partial [Pseudonocardia sp.]|nr:SDR family oxidoreductase [Pseudonocardia sp.]
AAAKAALHGLVHNLSANVAGSGVTINAIAPALIAGTRMLPLGPDEPVPARIPAGRLGTTEEVADLSLAMLRNGYLTNKVIGLDGGAYPD